MNYEHVITNSYSSCDEYYPRPNTFSYTRVWTPNDKTINEVKCIHYRTHAVVATMTVTLERDGISYPYIDCTVMNYLDSMIGEFD